jgi:predicted metal-dependent hydrolase
LAHLLERHHHEHFIAVMDKHLPQWRHCREELNAAPLVHATWKY